MTVLENTELPVVPGYKVKKAIGSGDVAEVYLAMDTSTGDRVALKVLSPEFVEHTEFSRRFIGEAEIIQSLNHPNVVNVLESGQAGSVFYFSMEYLTGGDLTRRLLTELSVDEISHYLQQLSDALEHVHNHYYYHGDLKPDNVLFTADGRLVLTDFGMAEVVNTPDSISALTAGFVSASAYLSPEQLHERRVDGRSNWYSLGVIAYEMLTAQLPSNGSPELPEKFQAFQPFMNKAMALDPDKRFTTGGAFMEAFKDACIAHQGVLELPTIATQVEWNLLKSSFVQCERTEETVNTPSEKSRQPEQITAPETQSINRPIGISLALGIVTFIAYYLFVPAPELSSPYLTSSPANTSTPIREADAKQVSGSTSISLKKMAEHYRTLPRDERGHIILTGSGARQ